MAIEALCGRCAARLEAPDDRAGQRLRCEKCGGVVLVGEATGGGTAAAAPERYVDPFADDDDFTRVMRQAAAAEESGIRPEPATPPPLPRNPAGPAPRSMPSTVAWPAPSSPTRFQPPVSTPQPKPRAKAKSGDGRVWIPRWQLSDDLARLIAQGLIISTIATSAYVGYGVVGRVMEIIPDAFKAQLWLFIFLVSVWSLLIMLLGIAPAVTGACKLAAKWTNATLPYDAYLRTTGVLAIPYLLSAIGANAKGEFRMIMLCVSLCTPLIMLVAIRVMLNLRWTTTLLSALLGLLTIFGTVFVAVLVSLPVIGVLQRVCGVTPVAIQKYWEKHPEELQAFMDRKRELERKVDQEAREAKAARTDDLSSLLPQRVSAPSEPPPSPAPTVSTPPTPPPPQQPAVYQPVSPPPEQEVPTASQSPGTSPPSTPDIPREFTAVEASLDLNTAMAALAGNGTKSRRDALAWLAKTESDDARRGEVAVALETALLGPEGQSQEGAEAVANALVVWWRPQTVDVLLPSIGERSDQHRRRAIIKVFAATKEQRAVYPIVRWIIREPDVVVAGLKSMGPVAEPEVIKLLASENDTVRGHAAQILQEIGTKNSLLALRRASRDKRSGGAAGFARIALEAVQQRAAAANPAATRPGARGTP